MSPSDLQKLWTEEQKIGQIFGKKIFFKNQSFQKKNFLSKAGFLVQYSSKKKQDRMYSDPKARNG